MKRVVGIAWFLCLLLIIVIYLLEMDNIARVSGTDAALSLLAFVVGPLFGVLFGLMIPPGIVPAVGLTIIAVILGVLALPYCGLASHFFELLTYNDADSQKVLMNGFTLFGLLQAVIFALLIVLFK